MKINEIITEAGEPLSPPIKYRNPKTGDTWTGRGLQPKWLKAAIAAGDQLEDFLISDYKAPQSHSTPKLNKPLEPKKTTSSYDLANELGSGWDNNSHSTRGSSVSKQDRVIIEKLFAYPKHLINESDLPIAVFIKSGGDDGVEELNSISVGSDFYKMLAQLSTLTDEGRNLINASNGILIICLDIYGNIQVNFVDTLKGQKYKYQSAGYDWDTKFHLNSYPGAKYYYIGDAYGEKQIFDDLGESDYMSGFQDLINFPITAAGKSRLASIILDEYRYKYIEDALFKYEIVFPPEIHFNPGITPDDLKSKYFLHRRT
jgi:hypothetical protein